MDQSQPGHNEEMKSLFTKWMTGSGTKTEWERITAYVNEPSNEPELEKIMHQYWQQMETSDLQPIVQWEEKCSQLLNKNREQTEAPVYELPARKRRNWNWTTAAAIIITIGIGTYLFITNSREKPSVTQKNPVPVQNDVAPGGNKATLTLADGSKIILDSAANGRIAEQGKTLIEKKGEQIVYTSPVSRIPSVEMTYNIMSTPRGGQYQLTLPDGSQVWLNAESSITYPTEFTGNERNVTITGEAYFEVAKDKMKPFQVKAGNQVIEVLGTHFNVNTYKDEETSNTTLLEGSVRLKTVHTSLILKPGQQGQLNPRNEKLSLAANPDVEQVVAWKNGTFNFNGQDFATSMRQIERWYDIKVVYDGQIPKGTFLGAFDRTLNLSDAIELLNGILAKFKLEGRELHVLK